MARWSSAPFRNSLNSSVHLLRLSIPLKYRWSCLERTITAGEGSVSENVTGVDGLAGIAVHPEGLIYLQDTSPNECAEGSGLSTT